MEKEILELEFQDFVQLLNEELDEETYFDMLDDETCKSFIDDYKLNDEVFFYIQGEITDYEGRYTDEEVIVQRLSDRKYFKGEYQKWGSSKDEINIITPFTEVKRTETITYTFS